MSHSMFPLSSKIVSRQKLETLVRRLKRQGNTIVTTNGSFDLLHIGHVTMLQEAKSLGDVLIVGVNSDSSIKRYKGKYRPICPEPHRVGMLAALACTDYVTVFDELTPIELLRVIQPHIHVNSPEHGKDCVERKVVEQHGGRIHLAHLVDGMSTTQLLGRIRESLAHPPAAVVFFRAESLLEFARVDDGGQEQRQETIRQLFTQFIQQDFLVFIFQTGSGAHSSEAVKKFLEKSILPGHTTRISFLESDKPVTEIFRQIADEWDVVLAKSVVISHEVLDIQAGRAVNCKTILTRPHGTAEWITEGGNAAHVTVQTLQELSEQLQRF